MIHSSFFSIYSLVVVSLSPHYGKNLFFMIIILQMFVHDYLTVLPLVNFLYLLYSNKLSKHAIFCLRSIPVSYAVFYTHCTVKALTVSIAQHFHTNNKLCCKFKMFYVNFVISQRIFKDNYYKKSNLQRFHRN